MKHTKLIALIISITVVLCVVFLTYCYYVRQDNDTFHIELDEQQVIAITDNERLINKFNEIIEHYALYRINPKEDEHVLTTEMQTAINLLLPTNAKVYQACRDTEGTYIQYTIGEIDYYLWIRPDSVYKSIWYRDDKKIYLIENIDNYDIRGCEWSGDHEFYSDDN